MKVMLHRFDLHMHSFYSADAAASPEELIAVARARGLSGIAITDHDSCGAHAELLKSGLEREDGQAVDGFLVVPGVEVSTADGHLLCLGTTLPVMRGEPAAEVVEAIHARGGVAIPAHPYDRWRAGIHEAVLNSLPLVAIEVFNAAVTSRKYNDRALAYAQKRGLAMTAASDAHHASAVGISVTGFELDSLSVADLLNAIRKGGQPEGQYLSRREAIKKHFGNFFRTFNRQAPPRTEE
jgi:predicted metal-dependent phosphoesterase TrpH